MHKDPFNTTFTQAESSPLTVSELTQAIKSSLESKFTFVTVQGEMSNCKLHSSGHLYFDLKDGGAKIPAVLFRATLPRPPKEGDLVVAKGTLSVYAPHGRYQLIVKELTYSGLGTLLLKFEQLKKKLNDLGWFDQRHKKSLPPFPKTIGVVTSPTGAVLRDIIQVLRRRSPGFHLILAPTLVQGEGAAQQIAAAIATFNEHHLADVLIVGRGGGSLEDLWPFNEEIVAKAIFESTIPIISAVGHETDVTLADFVADVRAPTPSAAAEIVSAEQREHLEWLAETTLHLDRSIRALVEKRKRELIALKRHPLLASPLSLFHLPMQRLDQYTTRLDTMARLQLNLRLQKLKQVVGQLKALDPKNVLNRGYAILFDQKTNHVIASSKTAPRDTTIRAVLADGELHLTVNQ